jgi:hypothetical protein
MDKPSAHYAPWTLDSTTGLIISAEALWRDDSYKATVAAVYGPDGEAWNAEASSRASAALMVAAPELADALDRYLRATEAHLPDYLRQAFCGLKADALKALNKATGGGRYDLPTIYNFSEREGS